LEQASRKFFMAIASLCWQSLNLDLWEAAFYFKTLSGCNHALREFRVCHKRIIAFSLYFCNLFFEKAQGQTASSDAQRPKLSFSDFSLKRKSAMLTRLNNSVVLAPQPTL
jgi:hypothetical protein